MRIHPYRLIKFIILGGMLTFGGLACGLAGGQPAALKATEALNTAAAPAAAAASQPAPPAEAVPVTATPAPAAAATPSQTSEPPTRTATPAPELRQLTQAGCCVQPFWSPDGALVLFLDRPEPQAPVGFWGVSPSGGEALLVSERIGIYSPDRTLLAYPQAETTVVERLADGERWTIANGGREVAFAPDSRQVAWMGGQSGPPFDTARRTIWISQVDGQAAHEIITVTGGGLAGWFPDGRLLVSGRLDPTEAVPAFWSVDPANGTAEEIVRGERLRGGLLSPDGEWLVYQVTFSASSAANGLWVVHTGTHERVKLSLFGAYRWRSGGQLLVIPLSMDQTSQQLWQVELPGGQAQPLTDPAVTPFRVANSDWAVSPDGSQVVFLSADDHALWLLSLGVQGAK